MSRRSLLAPLLLIAACNDPASNIGSDLVGGVLDPEVWPVSPSSFTSDPFTDITGLAPRVLAGTVDDPLFGSVAVTGHVDFSAGFGGTTPVIRGALLRLERDYVYGDTTSMVTLAMHDIMEAWTATGAKADTVLMLGSEVTTHTFLSADTIVTIPMPEAWVAAVEDTLRSEEFESEFHGLALVPVVGQAVVGFSGEGTSLQVIHSLTDTSEAALNDTTDFLFAKSLTTTARSAPPMIPDHHIGMQDGAGPAARITLDLEELEGQPINGAVMVVYVDTVATTDAPADFVRPILETLHLVAIKDEDMPALLLGQATRSDEGIFSFSGGDMVAFFYGVLFGEDEYLYLQLRAPVPANTLDAALFYGGTSAEYAPVMRFILSPEG